MASVIFRIIAIVAAAVAVYGWIETRGRIGALETVAADAKVAMHKAENDARRFSLEVTDLENALSSAEKKLDESESLTQQLKLKNSEDALRIKELNLAIVKARSENETLTARNQQLREETRKFIDDPNKSDSHIAELNTTIAELRNKITELEDFNVDLNDRISELSRNNWVRPRETASASNPPEQSSSIRSTQGISAPVKEILAGTILKIDHSRGLVIFNLGTSSGLTQGKEFELVKGFNKPIRIQIQSAQESVSVASFMPGENSRILSENDRIEVNR